MKSCITLGTFSVFLSTAAQENLSSLPESEITLRADIQTKETDILQQNLALSDERAKRFWFVQRSYENDLSKLGEKRLDVIRESTNWDNLNDATARDLGKRLRPDVKRDIGRYRGKILQRTRLSSALRFG
jgi:hypothetical protein